MNRNSLKISFLTILVIVLTHFETSGQADSLKGFSIKLSPGALTYYGDLSTNNWNIFNRIGTGSKFGFSAGIVKQFSPFFGIQAQFMAGSLYTAASDNTIWTNTYFAGSLSEFSLSARLDPLKILKGKPLKISPYLSLGVAAFGFRSVRREMFTNLVLLPNFGYNVDGLTKVTRQTAMSLPMTLGLSYEVIPNLQLELEYSVRLTNTDLLDCVKGAKNSNDLYSFASIGLRYTISRKSATSTVPADSVNKVPMQPAVKTIEPAKAEPADFNAFVDAEMPESAEVGETFDVKVRAIKGNYTGPAKITQKYPEGFTATGDQSNGNTFSFANQSVKLEWDKMPVDSIIVRRYRIKVGDVPLGNKTINGRFEYQQADGSKLLVRFDKTIEIKGPASTDDKDLSINQLLKQYDSGDPNKSSTAPKASGKGNIRPSQAVAGIEYRIQCGAFRDNKQASTQLASKYRITETIQEELIDGMYKYTVGSFRTKEEAVIYRDKFVERTKLQSVFIVAYRDGVRLAKIGDAGK